MKPLTMWKPEFPGPSAAREADIKNQMGAILVRRQFHPLPNGPHVGNRWMSTVTSLQPEPYPNQMAELEDLWEMELLERALRELYASAWRDPVPDEDIEWARCHRESHKKFWDAALRDFAGRWACDGYLKSSGGTFDDKPAPPYEMVEEAWRAFGERVRNAPAGEGELETVEAAVAAYSASSGQPIPPSSAHWLAALHAIRAALAPQKG